MNELQEKQLLGTYVEVYSIGGHIFSGKIQLVDKGRLCLEDNGKFFLVYRDKIAGIWMNAELQKVSESIEPITSVEYHQEVEPDDEQIFPENEVLVGNVAGLSLPSDILIPGIFDDEDDDLGIIFLDDKLSKKLNVVLVKDDKQDSSTTRKN